MFATIKGWNRFCYIYIHFTLYVPNVMPTYLSKLYGTETQIGSTNRKAYFVGVEAWTQPPPIHNIRHIISAILASKRALI